MSNSGLTSASAVQEAVDTALKGQDPDQGIALTKKEKTLNAVGDMAATGQQGLSEYANKQKARQAVPAADDPALVGEPVDLQPLLTGGEATLEQVIQDLAASFNL